jgi:hypothetical protein
MAAVTETVGGKVLIALAPAQVDHVVRAAEGCGRFQAVLAGLASGAVFDACSGELENRKLSRSLLMGLLVLATLPADGSKMGVAEIARSLGINTSAAHRYVTTLRAAGLVDQDPVIRRYGLAS